MMKKINLFGLLVAVAFLISCNNTNNKKAESETQVPQEETVKKDCNDVHWSHHKGEDGPENWKNLCTGFADCGGQHQSPINIISNSAEETAELVSPVFDYGQTKVNIINNSHTVQFNVSKGNKVQLNGKDYELLQFHYHALSEHTIDGNYFPLEVHFVHQHSATDFAVLGIMFTEGKENALFSKYLNSFPTSKGEYASEDLIDLITLFPENKSYYNYNGSLTTPPCTEVVNWYVLKNPVEASKDQIEAFSKILDHNYRPIMPLNDRKVLSHSAE